MLHGGNTALHIAAIRQMKDVVDYIIGRKPQINKKSDRLTTPLHEAVKCERVDITKILLDNGVDIEARDRTGQTPLHWALGYTNSLDQVRTLIINGADVNSMDEYARTPLHTLCSKGLRINFDTFELLLQKVSDINAGDIKGASPLHKLMRFLSRVHTMPNDIIRPIRGDTFENLDNTKAISFTRKEIFVFLKSVLNENINVVTDIVEKEVSKKFEQPYILPKSLKDALGKLVPKLKKKWQLAARNESRFLKNFDEWLNVPVSFTIEEGLNTPMDTLGHPSIDHTMGRPSTSWNELSDRSKRRRTEKVRNENIVYELAYATQMSLRASGNSQASKVIRDVTEGSPSKASQYRTSIERVSEGVLSGNEALSLVVEESNQIVLNNTSDTSDDDDCSQDSD
ncbi:poly [ADP-ribose] polymerase tankyrase-1-like [Coccinella septempunctata]|uniref:poly [ADP-ribose] polymerase tankyrase-1-like n=1 Tax=Coccinella septempunctata TaxID=41139 RepID=UPI001D0800AC|nr:poly [ADP-ribose] polymerase tankyrase-1-like [Coccinella septempunctata]